MGVDKKTKTRDKLIVGNWKMNKGIVKEAVAFAVAVATADFPSDRLVAIAPPFTVLQAVAKALSHSPHRLLLAAQNVHSEPSGAYTGEISATMLADIGCDMVIIGHSERRALFGETEAIIRGKILVAGGAGLHSILCVGETLEQRKQGRAFTTAQSQLQGALGGISAEGIQGRITIAYEPVWAIGTGETASAEVAQEMHAFIRGHLVESYGLDIANAVSILYGGSVKPENITTLMAQNDIDGALVGGASLDLGSFLEIIRY